MKIQYVGQKVATFEINKSAIKENIKLENVIINFNFEYGVNNVPDKHIWIGFKINAYIRDSKSQNDFLKYHSDFRGIAFPENKKTDLKDILLFVQNGLLNFQAYFQNNAPNEISEFQLINRPNEIEYANNFMKLLIEDGIIYSN
jgi:hypothetical protein